MNVKLSTQDRKSAASELGRRGGLKNVRKHGKTHMKRIGKMGANARWLPKEKE